MKEFSFQDRVHSIVQKIPHGEVLTYKEVARRAGNSKASRAVGSILNKNHDPTIHSFLLSSCASNDRLPKVWQM